MTPQTKGPLTILASTILFGGAGFWLMPNQIKGAAVGALAGGTAAGAYVQQDRRLRKLAIAQQSDNANIRKQLSHAAGAIEGLGLVTKEQSSKINRLDQKVEGAPQLASTSKSSNTLSVAPAATRLSVPAPILARSKPTIVEERAETSGDEAVQKIIEWFESRQVEVENYYEPDPKIDRLLDGLSLYLGDNYAILKGLHWKLRRSVGKQTNFYLTNCNNRVRSIHKEYIKKLLSSDYLAFGRVNIRKDNGSATLVAKSHQRADVQGFFDGGWFERYIYDKVIELLDAEGADYQYLRNPKIVFNNSKTAELDLFFLVNEQPLLIECKTGQSHTKGIEKFKKHKDRLGLDAGNAVFVILDIDEAEAHLRTTNWGFTVADQNDFLARIKESIIASGTPSLSSDEDEEENTAEGTDERTGLRDLENESLESFFKIVKLNLAPGARRRVLEELIYYVEVSKLPATFNDISKAIRDRLKEELSLSRHKVSEILNCVRVDKLFLDDAGKPVINTAKPIHKMAVLDIDTFEKACIKYYTAKILSMYDPGFFDSAENIALFDELTQSKALSAEEIEQIRERQED